MNSGFITRMFFNVFVFVDSHQLKISLYFLAGFSWILESTGS